MVLKCFKNTEIILNKQTLVLPFLEQIRSLKAKITNEYHKVRHKTIKMSFPFMRTYSSEFHISPQIRTFLRNDKKKVTFQKQPFLFHGKQKICLIACTNKSNQIEKSLSLDLCSFFCLVFVC